MVKGMSLTSNCLLSGCDIDHLSLFDDMPMFQARFQLGQPCVTLARFDVDGNPRGLNILLSKGRQILRHCHLRWRAIARTAEVGTNDFTMYHREGRIYRA